MYSSLDKIDILAEIDGRKLVVQTDHRTAQEIEDEPELSVLFAMTRVLNAQSWLASEGELGWVRYTMQIQAPPALRQALTAVGARLVEEGGEERELGDLGSLGQPLDDLSSQALRNLRDEEVQVERVEVQGLVLVAVTGGFYAAEKLLDPELLRKLHRMLGAELIAVAAPARGLLLATTAQQAPEQLGLFAIVAQRRFEEAGQQQISSAVLLSHDGALVGYASVEGSGEVAES